MSPRSSFHILEIDLRFFENGFLELSQTTKRTEKSNCIAPHFFFFGGETKRRLFLLYFSYLVVVAFRCWALFTHFLYFFPIAYFQRFSESAAPSYDVPYPRGNVGIRQFKHSALRALQLHVRDAATTPTTERCGVQRIPLDQVPQRPSSCARHHRAELLRVPVQRFAVDSCPNQCLHVAWCHSYQPQ